MPGGVVILRRFGLGLALVLGVLVFANVALGINVFSLDTTGDGLWWSLLGAESAVAFGCAGIAAAVLLGLRRWRHRPPPH